jgi:RNA polymerase sigma-70 factor (ECF subfamily)
MTTAPFACALAAWHDHHSEIKGYLARRLSDADTAEDLLQDVFLKAMREGAGFCALDDRRAWLFRVARNTLIDHVRRMRAVVPVPEDLVDDREVAAPVAALDECIERVLAGLADDDRDVIRRCDLEGMKLQAYADANHLALPAVKSRIQRARVRMRELMIEKCQVRFDDAGQVCCHLPRPAG